MEYDPINSRQRSFYFWTFVLIHTFIWTIGPYLLRPTLPHDTLESITWGLQWQWGYNKHPFLTAWLCAGIAKLLGNTSWSVYLLAQLSISATFIALWKLAQHMVSKTQALIAALALEGVFFYNINSFNMTPDTLQSPLWALLCLFFYRALVQQVTLSTTKDLPEVAKCQSMEMLQAKRRAQDEVINWYMVGLLGALCFCTKYQALMLFFTLFLFCLSNPYARQIFRKPGIYCALAFFFLLIMPHLSWLYKHQFITFFYATGISSEYTLYKNALSYFINPLKFFINSLLNVSGIFVLLWPFYNPKMFWFGSQAKGKNRTMGTSIRGFSPTSKESFDKQFLLFISLGPLLLTLLCCGFTGNYFPPRWATPYFFPLSLLILVYLQPQLTRKNLKQFAITLVILSSLLFSLRMSTFIFFPRATSDAFLPNKSIAVYITGLWTKQYHRPLPFLAGSHYLVAGVLPYLSDKPIPYLSWDTEDSSWINEQQIHKQGGIFIWDIGGYYTWDMQSKIHRGLPNSIRKRFPKLKIEPNYVVPRLSDNQPVIIGIAILPPDPLWSIDN